MKFLVVLVDENLTWVDHITTFKNKFPKDLGLLYKAKNLYYFFIHIYLNYGNIAWCSKSITRLKKLPFKQKQALRTIVIPTL